MADTTLTRQSNIELLRIISMVLIVVHHYAYHGFPSEILALSPDKWKVDILILGGGIGVNLFVLISGYFMACSCISGKKILRLWLQTFFFCMLFYLLFRMFPQDGIQVHQGILALLSHFLPIVTGEYWFVSAYLLLMLASPFLNRLLHQLPRMQVRWIIAVLVVFVSACPCLPYPPLSNAAGNFALFCLLYLISGYIRLHAKVPEGRACRYILFAILLLSACALAISIADMHSGICARWIRRMIMVKSGFPLLLVSLVLFYGFLGIRMQPLKWINIIASCTLGVYLVHDNTYVRPFLWKNVLHNRDMLGSNHLFLHCAISVLCVYAACTLVTYLWKLTVERAYISKVEPRLLPALRCAGGRFAAAADKLFKRYIDKD